MNILVALALVAIWPLASCQNTTNLPIRNLTIAGAQFTTSAYIDMGTFQPRINPLDDRGRKDFGKLLVTCPS